MEVQMKKAVFASVSGFLMAVAVSNLSGPIRAEEECPPAAGFSYVCGPVGAEDLVRVSGTHWVIGSGMGETDNPGKLHLIDTEKKSWETLYPGPEIKNELDTKSYPACTGPPNAKSFGAHGIAVRDDGNRESTLLAVNHSREAIEVFQLDTAGEKPAIRWIGCVPMDENIYVNSVAFLPDGGLVFTKFFDPLEPGGFGSIMEGKATGGVYEWHVRTGIAPIAGTELAGANGIAVSKDGGSIFLSAWGTRELVRFMLHNGTVEKNAVKLDFHPDNLRWTHDGKILVAGQSPASDAAGTFTAFKGWAVVELDPETLELMEVVRDQGESPLQNASVAINVDGTLWIGSFQSDRVAYKRID
jgi:hypothetical protein